MNTYTESIYHDLRREGYGARYALRLARLDAEADRAGVPRFPWGEFDVTLDGREYAVTVEPDPEPWRFGDDDVTGRLVERRDRWSTGYPDPVTPPAIALDERRAYEPGGCYDPTEHLAGKRRQGMARHAAWLAVRADLIAEAAPHVAEADYGEPRCCTVYVERDGAGFSVCGVEATGPLARVWIFDVIRENAAEVEYQIAERERAERGRRMALTAHG